MSLLGWETNTSELGPRRNPCLLEFLGTYLKGIVGEDWKTLL
jgi:hypothetical protein